MYWFVDIDCVFYTLEARVHSFVAFCTLFSLPKSLVGRSLRSLLARTIERRDTAAAQT